MTSVRKAGLRASNVGFGDCILLWLDYDDVIRLSMLIEIVMTNLLENAWKFTGKRSHGEIEFGVRNGDGRAREYFVRDNGAGFDATYASKLFGAFQRLHHATDFPGTGIGLATVQRIVTRHGGYIRAEGAPN